MPATIGPHGTALIVIYRLARAVLVLSALANSIVPKHSRPGFSLGNTFSYFTQQSNLIAATVFVIGAVRLPGTRLWLLYPLAYVPYTLIRGHRRLVSNPFLNPTRPGGYGRVLVTCAVLAVAMAALVAVITWLGNRSKPARRRTEANQRLPA